VQSLWKNILLEYNNICIEEKKPHPVENETEIMHHVLKTVKFLVVYTRTIKTVFVCFFVFAKALL
jgi:hypothetical protein